jgi:hypothetical protein
VQRTRENIRQNQIVRSPCPQHRMRHPFGPDRTQKACDAVAFCVGAGRLHANTIDIPGANFALEQFGHRGGKDAGTGAEIENGARPPLARHEIQHVEAAARRTMVAGAKSQRCLDLDCDVIGLDRVGPRFSAWLGRSLLDEAAAALLAQILGKHGIEVKVEPAGGLGSGRISRSRPKGVQLVCLSYLDADLSPAGARFAVRRLRRRLPEAKILAGFWQSGPGQASELCAETKADFCATSFKDAVAFCLDATVRVRQRA